MPPVEGAALALLEAMPRAQVPPNAFALGAAAAACVRGQWWHQALELVTVEMQQLKLKQTTVTYGTAVNACSVAAWWEKSLALLDNLQTERLSASVILCNSVIRSCERAGRWLEALQLLKATPERDVVGFSSALQACAKAAQWAMALAVFDQIPRAGLRQNLHATTGAIIAAGQGLHWLSSLRLLRSLGEDADVPAHAASIGACELSMQWRQALSLLVQLLDRSQEPNMACYNVTISACFKSGAWQQTFWLLQHLQRQGLELDGLNTWVMVEALGHSGQALPSAISAYRRRMDEDATPIPRTMEKRRQKRGNSLLSSVDPWCLGGEMEEMDVDDRDIGRIIGRAGCNIRDLQEGTKCKIITPNKRGDNDDPALRKVIIQGTKEQIARCKEAINGVLMGEEPKDVLAQLDGAVLIKNIEPMSMGHLAKIKGRIEQDMNVRIELDARSARIWSKDNDHDKAIDAKEKIEEEMEDITTVDTLTVTVPANIVNQVINDSALRQLQDQTGLTANVCKNDQGTGIRLTGLSGAIQEAKALIERRSTGEGAEFLALMPGLFQKMQPKAYSDFQRDLSFLMQNTGAQVTIAEGSNRADFRGGPDEVRQAKSELQKILHFYFPQECDTIELPPESVDWVAGDDDRELMRLQSAGAVIALDRAAATMWMCGNPRSVEQVRNRIRNSLQRWDREHAVIRLPSRESGWAIIGKGRASAGGMVMMVSGYGRDGEWMAENWPVDWEDQAPFESSGGSTIRELQTSTQIGALEDEEEELEEDPEEAHPEDESDDDVDEDQEVAEPSRSSRLTKVKDVRKASKSSKKVQEVGEQSLEKKKRKTRAARNAVCFRYFEGRCKFDDCKFLHVNPSKLTHDERAQVLRELPLRPYSKKLAEVIASLNIPRCKDFHQRGGCKRPAGKCHFWHLTDATESTELEELVSLRGRGRHGKSKSSSAQNTREEKRPSNSPVRAIYAMNLGALQDGDEFMPNEVHCWRDLFAGSEADSGDLESMVNAENAARAP
ncbi:unnamed protein product [Durusdinium trenchii]|uniref:C3H1-type domain-containing protein n=1 Tax=Durusdinium trenchii TaxID=1381693 RepID=A0ABP0SQ19_9DINO